MAYPEQADIFQTKLNKKEAGNHVVEEYVLLTDGKYEGFLLHDNVSAASINIYRGANFSGGQITNFTVTTDSDRAWKKYIRIYDAGPEAYINYETAGDQVEAEDINTLQESVHAVQQDVIDYKISNDLAVAGHDDHFAAIEAEKAAVTYVDAQLALKSDVANTYTKTETDERIQFVVDTAPEALDTLKEIAEALDNDPDFAATMTTQLAGKVDKVDGYSLSANDFTDSAKSKLDGIEDGAEVNNLSDSAASDLTGNGDSTLHYHTADRSRANHTGTQTATTISDFAASVRAVALTGLSTTTNTVIAAADTVLSAFGKLQAQVTVNKSEADLHVGDTANPHAVTKAQTGLGNVDNTADADKPVSTAMQSALNLKAPLTHVGSTGAAHGDATDAVSGFMSAEDKAKLDGVEASANQYVHPATHAPSIIVQDASNRFTTDTEKATWNAKASTATATTAANGLMSATDKVKLDGIESGAETNNITDVNATDLTDGGDSTLHYHTTDRSRANHTGTQTAATISDFAASVRAVVLTGLSTASSAVITTADTVLTALGKLQAQITANKTEAAVHASSTSNPHAVTKVQVALGNVDNTADADKPVSTAMQTALNLKAPLASPSLSGTPTAPTASSGTNSTQLATTAFVQNALSTGGYGDMNKSVYDADDDGIVDEAEKLHTARNITLTGDATGSVAFDGTADASMTVTVIDNSHRHNYIYSSDDRDVKPSVTPKHYLSSYFASKGGLTGTADTDYLDLMVLNTYTDTSAGYVNALAFDKASQKIQHYQANQTDTSWGTPKTIAFQEDSKTLTWGDLKNGFTLGG
jgi:hypothetical protein